MHFALGFPISGERAMRSVPHLLGASHVVLAFLGTYWLGPSLSSTGLAHPPHRCVFFFFFFIRELVLGVFSFFLWVFAVRVMECKAKIDLSGSFWGRARPLFCVYCLFWNMFGLLVA